MDQGYPLAFAPDHAGALPPELSLVATRMASFLDAGGRAIVLTGPPNSGKTALMEHLLSGLSGLVTRVRGGANGEDRPALSVAAILRQMGEPAPEAGDEAGLLLRTLAVAAYDEYSAVLAVDDAHALSAEALQALAKVPGLGSATSPGMTLILVGEPELLEQLGVAPGLEIFGNRRWTLLERAPTEAAAELGRGLSLAPAPAPAGARTPQLAPASGERPRGSWLVRHGRDLGLVGGALLAGAALATLLLTWPGSGPPVAGSPRADEAVLPVAAPVLSAPPAAEPARLPAAPIAPPETAEPSQGAVVSAPAVPLTTEVPDPVGTTPSMLAPTTPVDPPLALAPDATPAPPQRPEVSRPAVTQARLRQEFEVFLNRAGPDTAKLSPAARAALWREFLQWRARRP